MNVNDMIPWKRSRPVPVQREDEPPFFQLQRHFNRLFDDFLGTWGDVMPSAAGMSSFVPHVGVKESEDGYKISAELPGMDEKDIKVELQGSTLVIEGEKKAEHEEKKEGYVWTERRFGSFRRQVQIPEEVDQGKIQAEFTKGVLTVTLPRTPAAKKSKRQIEIKAA